MPPFWVPPTNRRFPSFHKILFDSGRSIPYFSRRGALTVENTASCCSGTNRVKEA